MQKIKTKRENTSKNNNSRNKSQFLQNKMNNLLYNN